MISIRKAIEEDIKILQKLNSEVFEDNFKYDPLLNLGWSTSDEGKSYYSDVINNEKSVCLIAEDEGKSVGYISAGPKDEVGRTGKLFEVYDMGVSPEHRSKGIGKMLFKECLAQAKAKGFEKAFVRVYSDNVKAVEFYRKEGLQEIEIGMEKDL